jgi:hypothetical protein
MPLQPTKGRKMTSNRTVKLNELESQQAYGPDYDFAEGINSGSVYGWDLSHSKGFEDFEQAFLTMDDENRDYGSLWRINYKTYLLEKDNDGSPLFIEVEVKII